MGLEPTTQGLLGLTAPPLCLPAAPQVLWENRGSSTRRILVCNAATREAASALSIPLAVL